MMEERKVRNAGLALAALPILAQAVHNIRAGLSVDMKDLRQQLLAIGFESKTDRDYDATAIAGVAFAPPSAAGQRVAPTPPR